ncbi:MAG: N-acetylmuramoyl-L-alanine amidase [Lachnospiraceae bacterium]|nr:N-acetylmuramoyl-L-alanine amidase [Lachnospiraceae bacterium]
MEEKILKLSSAVLTLMIAGAVVILGQFSVVNKREAKREQMSELQMLAYYTEQAEEEEDIAFRQQLRLELPAGMTEDKIVIENDYVKQLITIRIPDVEKDYFKEHPLLGRSDYINDLYMENGVIEITMDAVYEAKTAVKNGYLYVNFLTPRQVYDKVIVIDAGHGGGAPGAIKQGIMEKDINLSIVLELKKLLDGNDRNIGVYYTRTEDSNPTFEQRAQLGKKVGANFFISVHSNSTTDGQMSDYNGTEVMYDEEKDSEGLSSRHLAEICLEEITGSMASKNNGLTYGNGIYIIRNNEVPAALIEVGFMTNQAELNKLNSPEYQKLAAQGIYNAVLRALDEGY